MNVGSLFSGIGGLDLGLERAGMRVRWQCEIEPYCRAVLRKHWPDVPCYSDIRDIKGSGARYRRDDGTWYGAADTVDLICGGSPCQPVSFAGKGLAQEDPRWLWPEFARVVGLLCPRYVLLENVGALRTRGLSDVVTGLAEMGYDAEWEIVSAASVGAPHLRERYFVLGYANDKRESVRPFHDEAPWVQGVDSDTNSVGRNGRPRYFTEENWRSQSSDGSWWFTEPGVARVANGVPRRMDRTKCLGNAVVPQVAEAVGRMIMDQERAA